MNFKNIFLRSLGVLALTGVLASCEDFADDYLTQVNPNEFDTSYYWKTLADCNSGLSAVYNAFKNRDIYMTIEEAKRNDLAWSGTNGSNASPLSSDEWLLGSFNPSSGALGKKWAALYKGIFYANQVIAGLDQVKELEGNNLDVKEWTRIKAQAHFFRGLFYFYLNTTFNEGQVPIFDFVPQKPVDFSRPCNTAENVKVFYRKDLEYAEQNLPSKGGTGDWASSDLGRPTSETASAVLGTSYLYDARPQDGATHQYYDLAKTYFEKVINNKNYRLAGPGDNAYATNELNSESLLEVIYTYDYKSEFGPNAVEGLTTLINRNIATVGGYSSIHPPFWLYHSFISEPVDKMRAENKVQMQRDLHGDLYYYFDPSYTRTEVIGGVNHLIYPVIVKPSDIRPFINNSDMNFYIMWNRHTTTDRFKDVYGDKYSWTNLQEWNNAYDALPQTSPSGSFEPSKENIFSMVWPDSAYVFMKALRVNSEGVIAQNRTDMQVPKSKVVPSYSELTQGDEGQEGYYIVCDNKDMIPVVPFQGDRSEGAIKIYDADKVNAANASRNEQLYDYIKWEDSNLQAGHPYRYRNRSWRTHYTMVDMYAMDTPFYGYVGVNNTGKNWVQVGMFNKYTNWQTRKSEDESGFPNGDSDINLRLIRLADIYLMYAECLIKAGNDASGVAEATKYVNRVRYRASTVLIGSENAAGAEYKGQATYQDTHSPENNIFKGDHYNLYNDIDMLQANYTPSTTDIIDEVGELWQHIKHRERPMELVLDGHAIRSNDLRRWGEAKSRIQDVQQYKYSTTGTHILSLRECFQKGSISFQTRHKVWKYRFKYKEGDLNFDSYFWAKNRGPANTGSNYEYGVVTIDYPEYYPIPTSESNSNPYINQVEDREDLHLN